MTYIVVPAPGHYGDRAKILAAFASLADARRFVDGDASLCVREGRRGHRRGLAWFRSYEDTYPRADEGVDE